MKAWIGALLVGTIAAAASFAQTPAFNQIVPAPMSSPPPFMPDLPSSVESPPRSGAQLPGTAVPMPPFPLIAAPRPAQPENDKLPTLPDLDAAYLEPILPPIPAPGIEAPPLAPHEGAGRTRFWLNAEYLFWWEKRAPQPQPLVVTGAPTDPYPGALDQPNTQVLYGGKGLGYNPFSGVRLSLGLWAAPDNRFGFELGGFILEQKTTQFRAGGGPTGSQFLARPFVDALTGADNVYFVSQNFADPTRSAMMTGGIDISSNSRLYGYEINGLYNPYRDENGALSFIGGFTSIGLREKLHISEALQNLSPLGGVTYLGQTVSPATRELTYDKFDTMNTFYGPQLGSRLHVDLGRLYVDFTGKAGIGVMQQFVDVQGMTAVDAPNNKVAASTTGGVYAVGSNIGRHVQNRFGIVPQGDLNLVYPMYDNLIFRVGYTFLYMNTVARPGNQVNTNINPGLVPSDFTYGTPGGPNQPNFQFHTTNYWAQGVNFGVELRY